MRQGFTTGSCAAAAAKAAAYMLLTGREKNSISIITPKGIAFEARLQDIEMGGNQCSCAVIKDGGDDPDITTGALVYAAVSYCDEGIVIDGGEGVGRVTKPGLDQMVGQAAINHVPREMISGEVSEVMEICGYDRGLKVIISVPGGDKIAEKTFNPRLGIEGGISILGTSGIVEPMSTKAILDTIKVELNQKRALGFERIVISPGNYGQDFIRSEYNYNLDKSVKCSNFIGDTIDMAREAGYKAILLVGHIGKLVKLSGGIMNTHSKEADCRMELIVSALVRVYGEKLVLPGTDLSAAEEIETDNPKADEPKADTLSGPDKLLRIENDILACPTTEAAIEVLKKYDLVKPVMNEIMNRAQHYLQKRASGMDIQCVMFSKEYGILSASNGAAALLERCRMEGE